MGFLEPAKDTRPHWCEKPPLMMLPQGTRWQCDECSKIWVVSFVTQYNEYSDVWEAE